MIVLLPRRLGEQFKASCVLFCRSYPKGIRTTHQSSYCGNSFNKDSDPHDKVTCRILPPALEVVPRYSQGARYLWVSPIVSCYQTLKNFSMPWCCEQPHGAKDHLKSVLRLPRGWTQCFNDSLNLSEECDSHTFSGEAGGGRSHKKYFSFPLIFLSAHIMGTNYPVWPWTKQSLNGGLGILQMNTLSQTDHVPSESFL